MSRYINFSRLNSFSGKEKRHGKQTDDTAYDSGSNAQDDYRKNPYLKQLPRRHKLVLRLVEGRHYGLLRLLFRLKDGD